MIALKDVTKRFGKKLLFRDISVRLDGGDRLCLVGPSGSGKTTLLRMLIGMEPPTQGRVLFMDRDIYRLKPSARAFLRRNIGFIFQDFRLVPYLTVWQNVELPLRALGIPRARLNTKVAAALDGVGISQISGMYPASLSGGEQQRVAVARVMAMEPVVVLADEPFGNLDKASARTVLQELLNLNKRGAALIIATHDMTIAEEIKDTRVIELTPREDM